MDIRELLGIVDATLLRWTWENMLYGGDVEWQIEQRIAAEFPGTREDHAMTESIVEPRNREEILASDWSSMLATMTIIEDQLADGVPLRIEVSTTFAPREYLRQGLVRRIGVIVDAIEFVRSSDARP